MELRNFLMRHPRPVTVRVETEDGKSRDVAVDSRIPWVQFAAYIAELEPTLVECLDADGKVLRGADAEQFDHVERHDTIQAPPSTPYGASPKAAMMPPDPAMANLAFFASLLADAYRHTTDVAFDKMVDLFDAINQRGEGTEKALDRANALLGKVMEQRAHQIATAGEGEGGDLTLGDMMQAFMGGQQQAALPPAPAQRGPGPRAARPPITNPHAASMNGHGKGQHQ